MFKAIKKDNVFEIYLMILWFTIKRITYIYFKDRYVLSESGITNKHDLI